MKYMADRKASTISQMKIKDMMGDAFPTVSPATELDVISHMLDEIPRSWYLRRELQPDL